MRILHLCLYIVAAICFVIALIAPEVGSARADGVAARRWNFIAAGLLAWVCVPLSALINDMAND